MASQTGGGPVLESPKVVVGLDFGATSSGFAFAHISEPDMIYTFYDYPNSRGEKPCCKTPTDSYYKKDNSTDGGGRYQLKSWGNSARVEYDRDSQAARRQILSSGSSESSLLANVGIYLSELRLHVTDSSVTKLPPWLTVEALITDYLREMGVLILNTLLVNYGSALTKDMIQWCITVPSISDYYAKELMKTCMTGAGLVNGVDGSPHPLNVVLELEAASFHCLECTSQCTLVVGDRLLVVDIGFETTDIVVQEVVSMAPTYKVKEVTTSSRGLCGGTHLETRFMEFLHKKIGPCLQECFISHPYTSRMLIKSVEYQTTRFNDQDCIGEGTEIVLPNKVVTAWEAYDRNMDLPERDSYDELEITYEEMQSILDPEQYLELIADQLKQVDSPAVKVLVVLGEFGGSPNLMYNIKRRFEKRVAQILSPCIPGSAVCQGAVALTLNSHAIESRICKRTYGFSCTYKFEHDVDPVEYMKVVDGVAKCRMAKYGPAIGTLESPKVVVGLDFGATSSGFAFAHISEPDMIYTFYDYPNSRGEKPCCKTPTDSYYKKDNSTDGGGRYQLKSWGNSARVEYDRDSQAARRQILSSGSSESSLLANVGIYLSELRLHVTDSSVTKLPPWLTVEALITDYLREMGVLILNTLLVNYGSALTKDMIQWCITVPSISDYYAKELMKTCMTGAGLVNGVDGSPHPLNVVLELEAASFHCLECTSQCTLVVGDRLLVVDIGFETTDIVVQEVVSMAPTYKVKEVTTSSRGLCGGTHLETRFMEFLHKKIGPCLQECFISHPYTSRMLIKSVEYQTTRFNDQDCIGEGTEIVLPNKVVTAWEAYDRNMDLPERDSYDELEITYEEMQSILDPEQYLELIADQLKQVDSPAVKVLVVLGEFGGSPNLMYNIKRRFEKRVAQILSPCIPGSAVCQGAVALTLNSHAIESRICKRTYGFSCTYKSEHDVDPVEYMKVVDGVAKCRMAKYGPAIGIDLGTTNCRVGIWLDEENRFELISNEPSYVSFTETERLIGDAAKEQVCRNPANTVFDAKRLIGRKFSDLGTDVDEMHIQWPFKVTRGKDDRPMVHVEYEGKEKAFSTIDICSMLLAKLKDLAEVHSGSVVQTACVSVPHCFTYVQRMAMRSACSLAGFEDVRLVNEAVCAALGYTLQTIDSSVGERKVVIFDLGGGSLDVSLLSIKEREIEVKATSGDSQLGGEDFNLRLLHHFITEIKGKYERDITRHPRVVRRLKRLVERVKLRLSTEPEASLLIKSLLKDFTFYSTITRACFEQMNADLFARIMACVQDCLERARVERKDVDEVMLIGGSSRIPKVVELLTAFFDGSKLNTGINPDEAVVCGAAIADGCGAFQVVDVLPMSLGLERQQQLQVSRLRSTSFSASPEASSGEFSGPSLLRGVENAEAPHDRPELRRGATTGVDESHHLVTKAENTRNATSPQLGSDSVIEDVVKKYTWGQVLSMTNNLSKSIGKGGFGAVYLGKLDNEKEVAVKILDANSQQGLTEFLNEVNLLKRVNYVYLVRLLGYCLDTKQVLIYEYAEEGSIWDHLRVGGKFLDWKTRLKVALESACGLEYLHTGCRPRIIHRDIKSQNILLTKSMVAKVGDFGLSKLGADQDNVSKTHVTTMVKGTLGYLDPEYLRTGQLTEKSDVYSFGVVLLEIITGRKPIQNTDRKGFIGDWVEDLYNSNNNSSRHLKHIVDPTLGSYYNSKALKLVVNIAKDCIHPYGIDRPEMTKVVNVLRKAQMIEHDEKKPSKWLPFL